MANPTSPLLTAMAAALYKGTADAQQYLGIATDVEACKALIGTQDGASGGIFFPLSQVTVGQISDGTSNTFLCGEKYIDPLHYYDGTMHGDEWCCFGGYDPSTERYYYQQPRQDTQGYWSDGWGSPRRYA